VRQFFNDLLCMCVLAISSFFMSDAINAEAVSFALAGSAAAPGAVAPPDRRRRFELIVRPEAIHAWEEKLPMPISFRDRHSRMGNVPRYRGYRSLCSQPDDDGGLLQGSVCL
jgi:hypothetical protein